jgi:hypothetical protein
MVKSKLFWKLFIEGRRKREEGRGKREEGRRKKVEGGRWKEEERGGKHEKFKPKTCNLIPNT